MPVAPTVSQRLTFGASKRTMMVQTLRFSDHRDSEHFQERDRFTLFPTRAPSRPWRSGARNGVFQGWFGVTAVRALSRLGGRGSERFTRGARLSRARRSFSSSLSVSEESRSSRACLDGARGEKALLSPNTSRCAKLCSLPRRDTGACGATSWRPPAWCRTCKRSGPVQRRSSG